MQKEINKFDFNYLDYRKKIVSIIIFITTSASFIYVVLYIILAHSYIMALSNLAFIVFYLTTIYFLKRDKIIAAIYWVFIVYFIHTFIVSYIFFPKDAGIQNFFLVTIPISFIFFYREKKYHRWFFIIVPLLLFIFVQFFHSNSYLVPLSDINKIIIFYSTIVFNLAGFILIMNIFSDSLVASIDTLNEQKEQLKKLNENRAKILSIIGHDLRSPVAQFKSMVNLLIDHQLEHDEMLEYLQISNNTATLTLGLLENLLSWAKCQNNTLFFQKKDFNISTTIRNMILLCNNIASEKEITIYENIKPDIHVFADENMLATVIRNLISNAIKFTKKGGSITISTKDENDSIIILVKDSGIGIKEKDIQKILNGEHLSTRGTEDERGSGLGLSLCREFIEKNDGKIWITSTVGQGTEVCFSVPEKES